MPDTVLPRSALAGARPIRGGGTTLVIRELAGRMLLHLEGARAGAELEAVLAALDLAEPPAIGTSGGRNGARLLGLGPALWLLACDGKAVVWDALTLAGAIGPAFEVALDASHAFTSIEIAGDKAAEFITKGCALDLHPRHFAPGACAAAGFAGLRTILWRSQDEASFNLCVGRSYAVWMWEWMANAAAEYENASDHRRGGQAGVEVRGEE